MSDGGGALGCWMSGVGGGVLVGRAGIGDKLIAGDEGRRQNIEEFVWGNQSCGHAGVGNDQPRQEDRRVHR